MYKMHFKCTCALWCEPALDQLSYEAIFDRPKATVNPSSAELDYGRPGGGGGLPYITDGDARRNFQKKPLKVTILGVAPANFIP